MFLPEEGKIVYAGGVDGANAALVGDFVNMGLYEHCDVVIIVDDMDSQDAEVTLDQAATAAGATTTLGFDYMWTNSAAPTADSYIKTAVTSDTFDIDTDASMYIIPVEGSSMGATTPYLQLDIAAPGGNTPTYGAIYILTRARYQSADPPDATV